MFEIPENLVGCAYSAQNGERAWAKSDALNVIDWASANGLAVFGAEIWIPTNPGPTIPTPYIYGFEPREIDGESWEHFVARANAEAREFIRSFNWHRADTCHHGMTPYFNLTIGDE